MPHSIFGLALVKAKEIWIQAKGIASSLSEYPETLIREIEQALLELEKENRS